MIQGRSILAIIPARGGSKGVPRKNIRVVGGKPLIAWTIEAAHRSRYIDRLIVSTDDPEIASAAREWGGEVPFLRPAELAQDETPGVAPVLHALETLPGYDLVVLLQPTSPLRGAEDIDGCISMLMERKAPACVSLAEVETSPYWMYRMDRVGRMLPLMPERYTRRQDLPAVYALNGAVYVSDCEWLKSSGSFVGPETVGYLMPPDRSLDIDTEEDFTLFEARTEAKTRT